MSKKRKRKKHVPQRTCVGCRKVNSKWSLIRIVRTPEGVVIDSTGKLAGRGAYLHSQKSCWEAALKGKLAKALHAELSEADRIVLIEYMESLPEIDNRESEIILEE